MNFICFDLEGPLSPQDNAFELMKTIPNGDNIFKVISRYDDLLTERKTKGYAPGGTLALIMPFILRASISQEYLYKLSQKATLIDGAKELVGELKDKGWWVGDITTCYQDYGYPITTMVGIPQDHVACTKFPQLEYYREMVRQSEIDMVAQIEKQIAELKPVDDDKLILERLDFFFNKQLAGTVLGEMVRSVKPMGGEHKKKQLKQFGKDYGFKLSDGLVVGDSITDYKMLQSVRKAGGIAVAFNANEYALREANVGLASTNLSDLRLVTDAWEIGGKIAVEKSVREKEQEGGVGNRNHFHWLAGRKDISEIVEIHKRIRLLVREEAGMLG